MLELGQKPQAPAGLIKDVTEATFMTDVIDASQDVPVLVNFWAQMDPASRSFGPQLEDAVKAAGGKVRLAKMNVDQNQQIAAQLRIQAVPTVYVFWQGKPVDAFQGPIAPAQIKAVIDKLIAMVPDADGGLAEAVEAAETMLTEGAFEDAAQTFAAVLEEDPMSAPAFGGLVRALIAMGDLDQAEAVLNGAPVEISKSAPLEAAHAQLVLARQGQNAGPVAELRAAVEADPTNHQARFDLSAALAASGDTAGAVDQLLDLFRRDRDWNDGAAKAQLFTIFEALKPQDPIALAGRRKLSSLIFS